ncbi:Uncharacterised protein [Mycobacteroides abscessus subsp. abscessus]|nr:Uncharacterised protein [Mycobacteroides abscessus subsp. abscessus]
MPPTKGASSAPTSVAAMSVWLIGTPHSSPRQSGMAATCLRTRAWMKRTCSVDR